MLKKMGQTDGRTPDRCIALTARGGQRNECCFCAAVSTVDGSFSLCGSIAVTVLIILWPPLSINCYDALVRHPTLLPHVILAGYFWATLAWFVGWFPSARFGRVTPALACCVPLRHCSNDY